MRRWATVAYRCLPFSTAAAVWPGPSCYSALVLRCDGLLFGQPPQCRDQRVDVLVAAERHDGGSVAARRIGGCGEKAGHPVQRRVDFADGVGALATQPAA